MSTLVLFDIDGTLLDSGGAGIKSLNDALRDMLGVDNGFEGIECAGKTDISIIKDAFTKWNLPVTNGEIAKFTEKYVSHLKESIFNPRGHVKTGVLELLDRLDRIAEVHTGLLTGNVEAGAKIKLARFGISKYFSVGAYGDDSENRNELLPIAAKRFYDLTGEEIDYKNCLIIGDTPRDVTCAFTFGAPSLAVATGPYSIAELRNTEANLVVENLNDTEYIVKWIARLNGNKLYNN